MKPQSLKSWLPVGVCGLAFGLRVINLQARPLWYDEAFAVLFAEKGFSAMLAGTLTPVQGAAADVHPVVYYTALSGWMQWLGQSPLAVRLLSVFAGVLAVAVVYGIGRQLFGPGSATVGMLIAAALPFQIYYAQETRMYAGLALFCALTVWFYLRAASGKGWVNWAGLALSAAAAMYMQNLAGVFLLTFGLGTLPRPKLFAKVAAMGALAFGLWLPWFLNLPGQLAKLQQAYWITTPNALTLLQTVLVYHSGEELLEARVMLPLALFVSLVLPLMLFFQIFKDVGVRLPRPYVQRAAWLLLLAFGTPVILFLVSLYQPVYIQRALLPAGLMYAPVLGWLLWPPKSGDGASMPRPIRGLLAVGLGSLLVIGLITHVGFAQFPRPNFPQVVAYLQAQVRPGDMIVHSNKLTYLPMYYYDRTLSQTFVADPPGSGSDTLALPTQAVLGLFAEANLESATRAAPRVWFVIFDKAIAEFAPNPHPHLTWLEAHYSLANTTRFNDLAVYEFVALKP